MIRPRGATPQPGGDRLREAFVDELLHARHVPQRDHGSWSRTWLDCRDPEGAPMRALQRELARIPEVRR